MESQSNDFNFSSRRLFQAGLNVLLQHVPKPRRAHHPEQQAAHNQRDSHRVDDPVNEFWYAWDSQFHSLSLPAQLE